MKPERIADLVTRWVRFYTKDLPAPIAQRRINEIHADLHDHIAGERAYGTSDRRIGLSIVSRTARGLIADVAWRRQIQPTKERDFMKTALAIVATLILAALGIAAIIYAESDDSPGGQLIGGLIVIGAIWLGVRTMWTAQRSK